MRRSLQAEHSAPDQMASNIALTRSTVSKSSVQNAVRHLSSRKLIAVRHRGFTETPIYEVLEPWKR